MPYPLLSNINSPRELRELSQAQLPLLAKELRSFIIDIVAANEGHLGASLGVTELTIALHYVFNTPDDCIVWDVGHQAYGHKILTGRRDIFHTNRKWAGISGFPNREESEYDTFGTGHASTAISAALGMAVASRIENNEKRQHIAVVGDASIVGGMAFEGLNHAGDAQPNILIILNDNAIGIDSSVGALKKYFATLSTKNPPENYNAFFESLQLDYTGPIDGHNLPILISELKRLKNVAGAKVLHVRTTKGKGLYLAERHQVLYHAPGKFDKITGKIIKQPTKHKKYQEIVGDTLVKLAKKNEKITVITPAMPTGSGLMPMLEKFPERTFDVGIAEPHAVTFAGGLATRGFIPFCVIYSTFLQRSYDQIIHDIALQNLKVVFCIDRAGLVGHDGATHHGVFDLAYLRCIPNLIISAPKNGEDLQNLLYTSQINIDHPIAIRYPRGIDTSFEKNTPFKRIAIGKGEGLKSGKRVAILGLGSILQNVILAVNNLDHSEDFGIYDMRFLKPIDDELLEQIFSKYEIIITVEDGSIVGGFASAISEYMSEHKKKNTLHKIGIPDYFISHGSIEDLQREVGLDVNSLSQFFSSI